MNTTKNEILIVYNSNDLKDRETLGYAKTLKHHVIKELDIQNDKITKTQLEEIAKKMDIPIEGLLNKHSDLYAENVKEKELDELSLLKLIENNIDLLRTPISISNGRARFIDSSYEFINEDMTQGDNQSDPNLEEKPKKE